VLFLVLVHYIGFKREKEKKGMEKVLNRLL